MKTIKKLSDQLIAQIAAGEVIERPSYVVKELLDNAVDAKATRIRIDLEDGGTKRIVITDNGSGMSQEDIQESWKLHTTSKVTDTDHFFGIQTLGFRGEALASIASVSTLTIESKRADEKIGTKVSIFSDTTKVQSMGMPTGTRILVESLFSRFPARKKFLKATKTEFKHCVDVVTAYAIAYPQLSFDLNHNGTTYLHLPSQTLSARIINLLGADIERYPLPLTTQDSLVSISGYIGKPQLSSRTACEYVTVNGRPVVDKLIRQAVKEGFGILLDAQTPPSYILFFTTPMASVDINVHPRKEHIRFHAEQELFFLVSKLVSDTLKNNEITYTSSLLRESPADYSTQLLKTPLAQTLKKAVNEKRTTLMSTNAERIISVHNLYLILESETGVTLVDQHAAHERILYELYTHAFLKEKNKQHIVALEQPIVLELSLDQLATFQSHLQQLISIGFTIEEFSGKAYRLTHIPKLFEERNIEELIYQILVDIEKERFVKPIDSQSKKLLAYLACRSAVKSGDPLTSDQKEMLVKEIQKIPAGATCPHGRPLRIDIPMNELHKMFKRR